MAVLAVGLATSSAQGATSAATSSADQPHRLRPNSYAQNRCVFSQAPTVVWSSRVRKGKTYGACMNVLAAAGSVPGVPCALTRLERVSMTDTTLATLQAVISENLGHAYWARGWREQKSTFFFPAVRCEDGQVRQSRIVVFGLTDPNRPLGSAYARFVIDQAEQIDRSHLSFMQTRMAYNDPWCCEQLRKIGLVTEQMVLICNPEDDEHWINVDYEVEARGMREERDADGDLKYEVILSQATDNDANVSDAYRKRLETLSGTVEYERLVAGRWVRATGTVYGDSYLPAVHIIGPGSENFPTEEVARWGGFPRPDRPRYRAFDFGTRDPFVVGWYTEIDGALHRYREGYGTGRIGSDWARWVIDQERVELETLRRAIHNEDEARYYEPFLKGPDLNVTESWSDHDPEWRGEMAVAQTYDGTSYPGVWTALANKDIPAGIRHVKLALREGRLYFWREALVEVDPELKAKKEPTTLLQEFSRYHERKERPRTSEADAARFEIPVDKHNHGCDEVRYMVASHETSAGVGVW